ncbi:MarR family winged helix-turn-helix transcriptional regulator [Anaeromicropila populeti]|uniref:DNA-binding transcriptional regulator, MarR family n=1 Tax=Anaeromicropila populeti TaxID=37658 RepID=A0A1I6KCS4_9FIRM|nr:MarR family transcriptional regulator [Anaeromicropila populeti]SFR88670.1 DNA-binding transcriptional regulator, MarR family [Anaeromicropila populeti]
MDRFHHYLLRLYNVHKKINLKNFNNIGLSQGQPKIIELLLYNDGCSQKDLAKACELQPATMSALLKKMENDKLIHRVSENLSNGTHITRVFMTHIGKELAFQILEYVDQVEELCFNGFSNEEKEQCLIYLNRIYKNLQN